MRPRIGPLPEPGGLHRHRRHIAVEGRSDDRSSIGHEHLLDDGGLSLDLDTFFDHLAGHEATATEHAAAIRTDLFHVEVGVVDEAGGDAPRPRSRCGRQGRLAILRKQPLPPTTPAS